MSFLGELGHLICPLIYGRIFPQILGKHQIFPQFQWQIRPQNWWIPKFVLKFWDKFVPNYSNNFMGIFIPKFADIFVPKFGELPNLSHIFWENFSNQ